MTQVWTIMVISILSGPMAGLQSGLLYPSEEACIAAIPAIADSLSYDYQIRCEPTAAFSSSPRPKGKPNGK